MEMLVERFSEDVLSTGHKGLNERVALGNRPSLYLNDLRTINFVGLILLVPNYVQPSCYKCYFYNFL